MSFRPQREVKMKQAKIVRTQANKVCLKMNNSHAVNCATKNAIAFKWAGEGM